MSKYSEKFKDPRWQKKRLEILNRDKFTCQVCGETDEELHVHHGYYEKNLEPWEYDNNTLWTLCNGCHENTHEKTTSIYKALATLWPQLYDEVSELLTIIDDINPSQLMKMIESLKNKTNYNG